MTKISSYSYHDNFGLVFLL